MSKSDPRAFRSSIYEILEVLSRFLYHLGIFPYKLSRPASTKSTLLTPHTSHFRKGMSVIVHLLCHMLQLQWLLMILTGASIKDDPKQLFALAEQATYVMSMLAFTHLCFRQENGFQKLVQLTYSVYSEKPFEKSRSNKMRVIVLIICCGMVVNSIRMIILHGNWFSHGEFQITAMTSYCNHEYTESGLAQLAGPNHNDTCSQYPWKAVVVVYHLSSTTCLSFISSFLDGFIILIAYSSLRLSSDFLQLVQEDWNRSKDLEQIWAYYRKMKWLVGEVNEVVGMQLLFYMMAAIPYYSTHFVLIFESDDWYDKLRTIYYLLLYFASVCLAAEAHHKMEGFPKYIYKRFKSATKKGVQDQYVFLTEISTASIGLRGHGFFTVTYSFLGNVVGILMTYIIIILQFQASIKTNAENGSCTERLMRDSNGSFIQSPT